jgi:hypothetical protein
MIKPMARRMLALLVFVCGAIALVSLGACGSQASQEGYLVGVPIEIENATTTQNTTAQFLDVESGKEISYKDIYYIDGIGDEYVVHVSTAGIDSGIVYINYKESRKADNGVTLEANITITLNTGETIAYTLRGSKLVLSGSPVANPKAAALQGGTTGGDTAATNALSLNHESFAADFKNRHSGIVIEASPDYGYPYAFKREKYDVYIYLSEDGKEAMVTHASQGLEEVLQVAGVDGVRAHEIVADVYDVDNGLRGNSGPIVLSYDDLGLTITASYEIIDAATGKVSDFIQVVLNFS